MNAKEAAIERLGFKLAKIWAQQNHRRVSITNQELTRAKNIVRNLDPGAYRNLLLTVTA